MLNEDSSIIEFRTFNGIGTDVYPTLSLCFGGNGIFDNLDVRKQIRKIRGKKKGDVWKYGEEKVHYQDFLLGKDWDSRLLGIDYENVTLNARKLILGIFLYASNEDFDLGVEEIYHWSITTNKSKESFPFYLSFKSARQKCYSFDINLNTVPLLKQQNLVQIKMKLNGYYGGVFGCKICPLHFGIYLTYPNQLLRSFPIMEIKNMEERKEKNMLLIMAQGVEVIQRRSKANSICKEKWENDDNDIINELVSRVGCRQEHWNTSDSNTPVCKSQEQFGEVRVPSLSNVDTRFLEKYDPPCREIRTIISTADLRNMNEDELNPKEVDAIPFTKIDIRFKSPTYKIIKNVRAFNEESLVGNMGGYVGLFLGFAIWQAPELIHGIANTLRSCWSISRGQ